MLEIRMLGLFEVLLDGQPLDLPSRPAQSLLAYLALYPGISHRREKLAGLLWPESEETNARRYLSQALWRLRKSLGDRYFQADKLSLTFTPRPEDRLDVQIFTGQNGESPAEQMRSLSVYRGRLLPGFYEEWAWEQAEHLQALFERQAQSLLDYLVSQQKWAEVLEWGERWLNLGEAAEPAYRALMEAHAGLGDQSGVVNVYRRCVATLERDLGVAPSQETRDLFEKLRERKSQAQGIIIDVPALSPTLPAFLEMDEPPNVSQQIFVAREAVLADLEVRLAKALDGEGQVAFVVGEAGQGKTSLLREFLQRAQSKHPEILTGFGTCDAYAGAGDPYLPFRGLMGMLTGDVEGDWRSGLVPTAQARHIWEGIPKTVETLISRGKNLVGTLVIGLDLLSRARAAGLEDGLLAELENLVASQSGMEGMQQDFLFEQTGNVLRLLADRHPLVLVLDDLHWADTSSTGLLFHLGRRLQESRVLLLGAYRPEDLTLANDGQPHPLTGVIREMQRRYGEIEVNLDSDSHRHQRQFIDAYLDTEQNRLDQSFREAFAHHTGGHPLFTVETLHDLQARGDIRQDDEGRWEIREDLSWEIISARVEGVIANRVNRLSPEVGELLAVASVEGEVFTAEVLAHVLKKDARTLVRELGGPLSRHHRLVRPLGLLRLEGKNPTRLSQFRFRHNLFQSYLYQQLGESERAYLHEDVGQALESLFDGRTEEVAVQLARHFREAGNLEKEIHYLRQAGERAAAQFANEEAIAHFTRVLELLSEDALEERYQVLLARQRVYHLLGRLEKEEADLAELEVLAPLLNVKYQMEIALRQTDHFWVTGDFSSQRSFGQRALEMAREIGDMYKESRALGMLGYAFYGLGDYQRSLDNFEKALELAQETRNHRWVGTSLGNLGLAYMSIGRIKDALNTFQEALTISREVRDRQWEGAHLGSLGLLYADTGNYQQAIDYYKKSLLIHREIGNRQYEGASVNNLGEAYHLLGQVPEAIAYYQQALAIFQDIGDRRGEGYTRTGLCEALADSGELEAAETQGWQAIQLRENMNVPYLLMESRASLARVQLAQGKRLQAEEQVGIILDYLDAGNTLDGTEAPLLIYFSCYEVMKANQKPRADKILEAAYILLQERLDKIPEEFRDYFLNNIPWNSEILRLWEAAQAS